MGSGETTTKSPGSLAVKQGEQLRERERVSLLTNQREIGLERDVGPNHCIRTQNEQTHMDLPVTCNPEKPQGRVFKSGRFTGHGGTSLYSGSRDRRHSEFKAKLVYGASSRSARAT